MASSDSDGVASDQRAERERQERERRKQERQQREDREREMIRARVREREAKRGQELEKQQQPAPQREEGVNDSGTKSGQVPVSARGWNTAAFLISPIWGPANGVWLGIIGALILVLPIPFFWRLLLYLAFGAYLGLRGNELAWKYKRWNSIEHFKRVQQQWMLLALVVNIVLLFVVPAVLSG